MQFWRVKELFVPGIVTSTIKILSEGPIPNGHTGCICLKQGTQDLLWVSARSNTVVHQITEELHSQNAIQGHEEEEKYRHVENLLA